MIFKKGNLLDVQSGIILHGCNCQGAYGSGVAGQIRKKYPGAYKSYMDMVNRYSEEVNTTRLLGTYTTYAPHDTDLVIINGFTQEYFGGDGNKYVSYYGISKLFDTIVNRWDDDVTINIPDMIGCGLAGGDRNVVISIINDIEKVYDIPNDRIVCWNFN